MLSSSERFFDTVDSELSANFDLAHNSTPEIGLNTAANIDLGGVSDILRGTALMITSPWQWS
jgi:hypothetical protein